MPSYPNKNKKAKKRKRAKKAAQEVRRSVLTRMASEIAKREIQYVRRRIKELKAKVEAGSWKRSDLRDAAKAAGIRNGSIGNLNDVPNNALIHRIAEAEVAVRREGMI